MFLTDYFDDKGRFIPAALAKSILSDIDIVTLEDTKEMWFYSADTGVWVEGGDVVVDRECKRRLGDVYAGRHSDEVKRHIKASTYFKRERFNSLQDKINMRNGVLDVNTLEILQPDKLYYFTYRVPVNFNKDKVPFKIMDFFKTVYEENPRDVINILEYASYVFVEGYPYKKAMCLVGEPDTGKTSVLRLLLRLFDGIYSSITLEDICDDRFATRDLYGKRVNIADELGDVTLKGLEKFKKITGGSPLRGEAKYERAFTFVNSNKPIFACNILPKTSNNNDIGFFGRWILVENKKIFDHKNRIPHIWETICTGDELSGLFNLLLVIRGKVISRGFQFDIDNDQEEVRTRWLAYTNDKPEHDFCKEKIKQNTTGIVTKEELYIAYKQYCQDNGFSAKSQGEMTIVVKEHFINIREGEKGSRHQQKHAFRGISLVPDDPALSDARSTLASSVRQSYEEVMAEYSKVLEDSYFETKNSNNILVVSMVGTLSRSFKEEINREIQKTSYTPLPSVPCLPNISTPLEKSSTDEPDQVGPGASPLPAAAPGDDSLNSDPTVPAVPNMQNNAALAILDLLRRAPTGLMLYLADLTTNDTHWNLLYGSIPTSSPEAIDNAMKSLLNNGDVIEFKMGNFKAMHE